MFVRHRLPKQRVAHVGRRFAPAHLAHDAVGKRQLAMRPGADAEVVTEGPVVEVVRAAVPRPREGRHLVARQARRRGAPGDEVEHVAGQVVVGQPRGRPAGEGGIGLDRQVVDRQVRRIKAQRLVEIGAQRGQVLPGQRIHQVDVEGVEGRGRLLDRGARLRGVVHAADGLQVRVGEALHADRQPRHAGGAEGPESVALEGAGVGLERDLAARLQRQPGADVGQQAVDARGRKQAGRAAADEDAEHAPAPDLRQRRLEVGTQGIEVGVLGQRAGRHFVRVEVAVGALAQAPGQVHIQRQRRQRAQRHVAAAVDADRLSQGARPRAAARAAGWRPAHGG